MRPTTNMTGQRFGYLVPVLPAAPDRRGAARWLCWCDGPCGGTSVTVRGNNLRSGNTRSCGCLMREVNTTHGHGRRSYAHPRLPAWNQMRQRCNQPNHQDYARYGGRGIRVCERWDNLTDGFVSYLADTEEGWSPGMHLDRIDNDRGYELDNWQWLTRSEHARKHRRRPS